jgi:hypothetical protein
MDFKDGEFRSSQLIRLQVLRAHIRENRLSQNLEWIGAQELSAPRMMELTA